MLDLTESHACELYWHSVSKPYCILFLSETCSPAWVPIFLSDRNRFLILGSIQWIWLLDVCSYFHSSSCIYGCAAGTSVWFLRHYLLDWWKGKKKGENGCLFAFLSQECAVIWNKTITLFVLTSLRCWICIFINLLIPWLTGKTISRRYGLFSILLEHLLYTMVDVRSMVDKVNYYCSTKWIHVSFFSPLLSLKVKMISGSLLATSCQEKPSVIPFHLVSWLSSVTMKSLRH